MHKITSALSKLSQYLVSFGPFGLFTIAFLDSVMIPMPGGVDAVLLLLAASRPSWMLIYVAAATVGSTLGCVVLYRISQRAGKRALSRFSESKQKRVKDLIDRYDVMSVLVASLLPPPFPFKLFVVSSGVFRLNIVRFTIAIAAGRTFRYLLEGYIAAHYGDHAKEILSRYYPTIGITLAVLVIVFFVARALMRQSA
ncbi:MAG TPA: VTT domain-containing protein, partial [Pyrinomonadaceae bacterium]|nr:VTT domain-containing protein [Pyrinomonadaceae bacterium]